MEIDVAGLVERSGWLLAYLAIFAGGLALNLTPCVYPLIPITVGYFTGQRHTGRVQVFALSLLYVLGIAITYSAIGVAAALSGQMLGFLLQKPAVLVLFSGLMLALAAGQFGLFDLPAPSFLLSHRRVLPKGLQALSMGLAAGIVAAPCIGPFVLGLLLYVGRTRDLLTGFTLFLTLALGLGLPYLLLGVFSGAIGSLPRSGAWMVGVKKAFGFVLLALALAFAKPVLGSTIYAHGMALLAAAAVAVLLLDRTLRGFAKRATAAGIAVAGLVALGLLPEAAGPAPDWTPYSRTALERAKAEVRPALIDFYADWCLPCKKLDALTFSRLEVREATRDILMVKADVTLESSEASQDARERFGVEGVPAIVFLDGEGRERSDLRLAAFVHPPELLQRIRALRTGEPSR